MDCHNSSRVNQIANIFVHKCKQPKKSITNDIADMISLFENCIYFAFGKKNGLLKDIRKVRNEFFAHNSSFTVDETDIRFCLDRLSTLLNQPLFRSDKKCEEMYKRVCNLKDSSRRVQYNDITDTRSMMQPFLLLYHDEPMIVVEKANELISNIKHKPLTRPLHRRYDLILAAGVLVMVPLY